MAVKKLKIQVAKEVSAYGILLGSEILGEAGIWAQRQFKNFPKKVVIVSNPPVYRLYGNKVAESLSSAGFDVSHFLMKDGERHKNLKTAEAALKFLAENNVSRSDAIVALGGGVVGDLAGFVAGVYLRGIRFLQIPTTLLAMVDSSVGGKTGVNTAFGKNLVGAFHQPSGVLVDVDTLSTLPQREVTAGLCEMVKHAAIAGKDLLQKTEKVVDILGTQKNNFKFQISSFKSSDKAESRGTKTKDKLVDLISENIEFKAKIVASDERESTNRTDARSRKVLNFGHTLAHALEKVTDYRHFRHGEAVGYGILYAAELSKSLALIDEKVVNLLYDVVHRVGPLPSLAHIDGREVIEAFRHDKKQTQDGLQMILLKGIGKPVIVSASDIPQPAFLKAFLKLQGR